MPISERDQAILKDLEKAASEHPDLSAYYELHRTLIQMLTQAKTDISATLAVADGEALQAGLQRGLPMLTFAQLPIKADCFADLVAAVAEVLKENDPGMAGQMLPDSPAECLALAQQRFVEGQAEEEQGRDPGEKNLAQLSVDLALRPYLEWAAEQLLPRVDQGQWKQRYCPVCGGPPDFALLEEEAGSRYLLCSRCSSQWGYRRLGCPFCGTDEYSNLSYYPGEGGVYRLYVCQACRRYLKTIDLRKVGRQVLLPVERITTVAMDLAALEKGYR